jgi:RNA polymerase sigma factor (sigma-70 family)
LSNIVGLSFVYVSIRCNKLTGFTEKNVVSKAVDQWGEWMAGAQAGDARAYRALLEAIEPWLSRYFHRRVPPGNGDDLVQEAMVAIHRKRHTYDPAQRFGPWLAAVARYKWIDWLRAQTRRAEVDLPADVVSEQHHGDAVLASLSVEQLLAKLKPAQSQVIRLVKVDGLSIEEASLATGQSQSLVKVNIHRGMQVLMKLLEDADE